MKRSLVCCVLAATAAAFGCASPSPSQPTDSTAPISGGQNSTASIVAPRPLSPANNAAVRNADQPITLTAQNAFVTGSAAVTYTFEVAGDAAFANRVQTFDNVAEGAGGQTSQRLDQLAALRDYWWHVRATSGGTTGVFGPAFKFTIGPAITISTPVPIAPLNGTTTPLRPALRVANVTRTGPAGAITYRFDISPNSAFTSILVTGTNAEGINETGFVPANDLPADTVLFWRASALDVANGITTPFSAAQSFTPHRTAPAELIAQQLGVILWPGEQPPNPGFQATLGDNWQIQILHHLPTNTFFQSPTLEMIRFFDLFDHGFDPQGAIDWMNTHGYRTLAQWYPPPEKAVLGLDFVYIAARNKIVTHGTWDIVLKTE
jgi:hypothetical protein